MLNARIGKVLHVTICLVVLVVGYLCNRSVSGNSIVILLASFFLVIIVITDSLYRKIPNLVSLIFIVCGFTWNIYLHGVPGLLTATTGLVAGLALLLPVYLLGGMGAGDVKAFATLGTLTGLSSIFQIFFYTAFIGGAISILHYCLTSNLRQKSLAGLAALRTFIYTRDIHSLKPTPERDSQRFPYAAAIALGFFAFVQWGPIVTLPH